MQRGIITVKASLQQREDIGIMMKTAKLPCGKERGRATVLFLMECFYIFKDIFIEKYWQDKKNVLQCMLQWNKVLFERVFCIRSEEEVSYENKEIA